MDDGQRSDEAASTERLLSDAERDQTATQYQTIQRPISPEDLEFEIHRGLDKMIKNSTTRLGTAIILPTDVGDFWDSLHKSSFYTRQPWYDRAWDRTSVMSEYRTIMSILIKSGFKRWKYFKKVFIDKENRKDKNLPFSKDEIQKPDFLDVLWREFYVTQWLFCPLKIVEDSDPVELNGDEEERRFPFIKPEKEIGSGAAGTVYKQVIAPGHIKYRSQGRESSNEQVS